MKSKRFKVCLMLFAVLGTEHLRAAEDVASTVAVHSPDGKNVLAFNLPAQGQNQPITYTVVRSGKTLFAPSAFNLSLAGRGRIADRARLVDVQKDNVNETFSLPWGKCQTVANQCGRACLKIESAGIVWNLELRAYDDGVAFRYGLPDQDSLKEFTLEEEATEYRLADNPALLFQSLPNFTTPHENTYQKMPLAQVPAGLLLDTPLLAVWPGGMSAAVAEGRLRDFAGMYLERTSAKEPVVLRSRLAPLPARPKACVSGRTPHSSPWRVILLADHAGKHLESNLLLCLNDPPQGDYSWVKPGKTTWTWWNGSQGKGLPFAYGMNFETNKYYIDFCAKHGIAYHAVPGDDRPWHEQAKAEFAPDSGTNILRPIPQLEMQKILDYAKGQGVGIRLWVHWKPLHDRLEEAFTQYEAWGVRGLMVDFLDRNDQEMVNFCDRVLESAARHKLHIQFHGSYPPSGEQRTFPHLFNREAVLNLEYLKWGDRCTPQHDVNVAYTRLLAGPTDYHLGGFRAVPLRDFKAKNNDPNVLGTRAHMLALYVIYENPMPMICDTPSSYEGQPGFGFLEEVPTVWDETRFLQGEAGDYVVVARRRGDAWYLGGITNATARQITLPLSFLKTGDYEARLFLDGSDEKDPNAVRRETQAITAESLLNVSLSPGGGFTAIVRPK